MTGGVRLSSELRGEVVQTCASVPLQNFEYFLLKKYDEEALDILALDFNEM